MSYSNDNYVNVITTTRFLSNTNQDISPSNKRLRPYDDIENKSFCPPIPPPLIYSPTVDKDENNNTSPLVSSRSQQPSKISIKPYYWKDTKSHTNILFYFYLR